jgi:hypothetical protein
VLISDSDPCYFNEKQNLNRLWAQLAGKHYCLEGKYRKNIVFFQCATRVNLIIKMSDEIITRQIKKFDGTNFQTWKFQMKTAFISHGLLEIVTGIKEKPGQEHENDRKAWIKEDTKAMFIISSTLEESQLECLLTCASANEMWTRLSVIHEQRSASSKLILTQKFHEYKMQETDSVIKHISKVQNMAARLNDIGENVSDVAVIAKILAGLPSKYNALKTAWDSVDADKQTIAKNDGTLGPKFAHNGEPVNLVYFYVFGFAEFEYKI